MQEHLPFTAAASAAALFLAAPVHAQIELRELATLDLSSTSSTTAAEFIGSNPSAVAWDGTDLFLAGMNGAPMNQDVGIVKVSDALGAATFGTSFGRISTPNLRGYSGLDIDAAGLAAAYDNGGNDPLGTAVYDTGGNLVWSLTNRGSCGIGFDPGFPGGNPAAGQGVAFTNFGSGRRRLHDSATGLEIWGSGNGMVILTPEGTFWRDMDFDPDTGDVYLREGNNLIRWERSGDNSLSTFQLLYDAMPDSDFVNGQNVAYLDTSAADYVIWNERNNSGPMQDFFASVRVVRPTGQTVNVNWGAFAPAQGIGYYDFSWHAPSRTLAIVDFANRNAHIFELVDEQGTPYCGAVANSTGVPAAIWGAGSVVAIENNFHLTARELPLNAFAFFLTSQVQGFAANPGGSQGNLCLSGSIGRFVGPGQIQTTGSTGRIALRTDLTLQPSPTGPNGVVAGQTWFYQCWYRDSVGGMATSNFTNGLEVLFL